MRLLLLAILLSSLNGLLVTQRAFAAAAPKGITISPFRVQLSIAPDDASTSYNLQLKNNTKALQELRLSSKDFGTLDETGGVLLEGANSKYTQKYGLVSWLKLGTDTVVLNPGESAEVPVTVDNRTDLQPGGHYAAVVVRVNSLDEQTGNKVFVNQQLLSLLFLKKAGGEHYDLKLNHVEHNGNWLHLPSTVTLRFQNPGNVHVVPRGIVRLKSPSGKVLSQGVINTESSLVLPETFREIYVPLKKVSSEYPLPGPYSLDVEYRYDGVPTAAHKHTQLTFISLPTYMLAALVLSLTVVSLRRYKRASKQSK